MRKLDVFVVISARKNGGTKYLSKASSKGVGEIFQKHRFPFAYKLFIGS